MILPFLISCAQVNIFYNAKKSFEKAEKMYKETGQLTPGARDLYNKTIEKTSKLLALYPNDKRVKDALLLMLISHIRLKEKEKAKKILDELSKNLESFYLKPEIQVEVARFYYESEDYPRALSILESLKSKKINKDIEILLIKTLFKLGRYDKVVNKSMELMKSKEFRETTPNEREEIIFTSLEAARNIGDSMVINFFISENKKFFEENPLRLNKIRLIQADLFIRLGEPERGLELLNAMDLPPADTLYLKREMLRAEGFLKLGDTLKAKEILYDLSRITQFNPIIIEAMMKLAYIHEIQDSLEQAMEIYSRIAVNPLVPQDYKDLSQTKINALFRLMSLDTLNFENQIEALYRYFEYNFLVLKRVDVALDYLKKILANDKANHVVPKALYALVLIYSDYKHERDSARYYYERLLKEYPHSLYAKEAETNFSGRW